MPRRASGSPRRGAAATDTAARAEARADAGRNAALQTLSVNGPLVAGGEPRLELIGHLTALLSAGGAEGLPVIGRQLGRELVVVQQELLISVKGDAGTRNHLDLLLNA